MCPPPAAGTCDAEIIASRGPLQRPTPDRTKAAQSLVSSGRLESGARSGRGGTRFLVVLSSVTSGELLEFIEADYLGQARTGAATGLATKYMARPDARRAGIYGAVFIGSPDRGS